MPVWKARYFLYPALLLFIAVASPAHAQESGQPATEASPQAPAAPQPVTINVLTFGTAADGKAVGHCSPVRITADGTAGQGVRVGFFESEVGGTGAQWRSAGWTAAVTAALVTNFNPRSSRIAYEYEGRIDGPSAGGLMTIGVLAAIRGDTVRPDAAMTGTINPDATIGPVGGIVQKIGGAADKGMKLVLIPADKRFDKDGNSGELVDLIEHGQKLGVEVKPVFDLYSAYEALTGVELPRAPSGPAPRVSVAMQKRLQEKMRVWYDHYEHALTAYSKMEGKAKLSQEAIDLYQKGVNILAHSNELKNEGEFSAALWDRVQAAAYGYLALETGRCRQTYANRGYAGLAARLRDNGWLAEEIKKTAQRMREETPQTLDQLSMYIGACDAFLEALSLQLLAKVSLARLPQTESEAGLELARNAAGNQILAWLDLKLAGDYLDLSKDFEGTLIPKNVPWRQTVDYLRRASSANLAVFESLVIEPNAKSSAKANDAYRLELMQKDQAYAVLFAANEYAFARLGEHFGDGDAAGYAYLAASIYTHVRTAGLLAKYYSLGANIDDESRVIAVSKERTLGDWLTFADDQCRRNIGALQRGGVDATACAQMYEIARIKARRGLEEKVEALVEFWNADLHAQLLHMVSGVAGAR